MPEQQPISVALTGDKTRTAQMVKRFFPNATPEQVARAAGVVSGMDARMEAQGLSLLVTGRHKTDHSHVARMFHPVVGEDGTHHLILEHSSQEFADQHKGKGYQRFADQLQALDKTPQVRHIIIPLAAGLAGSNLFNGSYTWPRFGFNAPLAQKHRNRLTPELSEQLSPNADFHELFSHPEGAKEWKENPAPIDNMEFDLHPDSEHRKRFRAYYDQRQQKEQQSAAAGNPLRDPVAEVPPDASAEAARPYRTEDQIAEVAAATWLRYRLRVAKYKQEQAAAAKVHSALIAHAAAALDAPSGERVTAFLSHLQATHAEDPSVQPFIRWGAEGFNNSRLSEPYKSVLHVPYGPADGEEAGFHLQPRSHSAQAVELAKTATGEWLRGNRHSEDFEPDGSGPLTSTEVAQHLYDTGGAANLAFAVAAAKHFAPNQKRQVTVKEASMQYATEQAVAHPSVAGFQLEHALRRAISDPETTSDLKALSHALLTEGVNRSDAAYGIHAEVEGLPEDHWLRKANYNWSAIPHKLHLDAAVGHAIDAVVRVRKQQMPDLHELHHRFGSTEAIAHFVENPEDFDTADRSAAHSAAQEGAEELLKVANSSDLMDSLERHQTRNQSLRNADPTFRGHKTSLEQEQTAALQPLQGWPDRYKKQQKPLKYQSPALSDFISAVRQIRSSNQEVRRQIAEQQYKKLGLSALVRDAIADAPHTASANTAQAVEHNGDLDKVRAAAALYAQQTESPQLLLFHEHAEGQDLLHKFDAEGSAEKLRQQLDAAGLYNRTLSPTPTGWSAFFFDPKGEQHQKLLAFTQKAGYNLETSVGTGERVGEGQEAEANKENRSDYRQFIQQYEKQQGIR